MGDAPIHKAAQNNSLACARALIHRGAEINAVGSFSFRATHFAARDCHPEMLRLLLENGADHSPITKSGDTPAHFAARNRDLHCLKTLREAGAHLCGRNSKYLGAYIQRELLSSLRAGFFGLTQNIRAPLFPCYRQYYSLFCSFAILIFSVVADESPAMISERLSNEEIMIWMREENIFGV
jgi:ankyrin repeat protein